MRPHPEHPPPPRGLVRPSSLGPSSGRWGNLSCCLAHSGGLSCSPAPSRQFIVRQTPSRQFIVPPSTLKQFFVLPSTPTAPPRRCFDTPTTWTLVAGSHPSRSQGPRAGPVDSRLPCAVQCRRMCIYIYMVCETYELVTCQYQMATTLTPLTNKVSAC